jgi:uncharacterized membrane protein YidH (DUF202 family)
MNPPPVIRGDDFEGLEEGLAAERTDLAWSRSWLSMAACGVIIAKGLPGLGGTQGRPIIGVVVLVLGTGVWLLGWVNAKRRREHAGDVRPVVRWHEVAPVAFGTAIVGTVAFLLGVFTG